MTKRFETPDPEAEMICRSRVSCWDLGPDGPLDRYTAVFLDFAFGSRDGVIRIPYLRMNDMPASPTGFRQHDIITERCYLLGRESLGKRIRFADLPDECRRAVEADLAED